MLHCRKQHVATVLSLQPYEGSWKQIELQSSAYGSWLRSDICQRKLRLRQLCSMNRLTPAVALVR